MSVSRIHELMSELAAEVEKDYPDYTNGSFTVSKYHMYIYIDQFSDEPDSESFERMKRRALLSQNWYASESWADHTDEVNAKLKVDGLLLGGDDDDKG